VFLLSFRNNDRNRATQSSAVTQKRSSRSNVTLLSSATINSLCRKDNRRIDDDTVLVNKTQPSQRRRQRQPPQQQTATLLLQQPWRSNATLLDSYVQQFCSTVLLDSSTLAGFCYCAHIASAIALMSFVTINQICLDDKLSYGQPTAFVCTTAIAKPTGPSQQGQANMAKPICFYNATKRRQATTDSLFQATNGPADRPM
jgi:hypothetical protein